jgi:hypothetical protein
VDSTTLSGNGGLVDHRDSRFEDRSGKATWG